jgi:subtilisin family serine protease
MGRPTGKGLRVCVIDSGWDRECDDPRVQPGIGLVDPQDDLAMARTDDDHDRLGHGTACIHQILRIAPDVEVIPVRVFGRILETSPGTLQAGILYAIEQGVDVVNLSLGTQLEGTLHPLYAACEKARRMGMIVVAAGHNARDWSYPAIFENVIGVSAARFDSPWEYRYLPDEATECEAWGVEQPVTWLKGEETVKHGTSFAAPNITGIICLLLERHPGATLEEIRELLAKYALPAPVAAPKPRKPRASRPKAAKSEPAAPKRTRKSAAAEPKRTRTTKSDAAGAEKKSVAAKKPAAAAKKQAGVSKAKPATEAQKRATKTSKAAAGTETAESAARKPRAAKAPEEAKTSSRRAKAPEPQAVAAESEPRIDVTPARRRSRRPATAGAGGRTPKS